MGSKPLKVKYKKGLWSPDEDQKLRDYILNYGHGSWSSVPVNAGLQRNGKSCRLRWINYLRPGLKRGIFTTEEEDIVMSLHQNLGNMWSQIAHHLPGRTDNEIKNYWHSYLKKKLVTATSENIEAKTDIHLTMRTSSFDSFEPPSAAHLVFKTTEEAEHRILPKVLFTEWLSLDHFHEQEDFGSSSNESSFSKDSFYNNPNFQDTCVQDLLLNEGYDDINQQEMFQPHLKLEDRFVNWISEDNMFGDFNDGCF